VAPDQLVDLVERVAGGMSGPGQTLGGIEHGHVGRSAAFRDDKVSQRRPVLRLRHEKTP
jgi:hypothetical protein